MLIYRSGLVESCAVPNFQRSLHLFSHSPLLKHCLDSEILVIGGLRAQEKELLLRCDSIGACDLNLQIDRKKSLGKSGQNLESSFFALTLIQSTFDFVTI